MRDATATPTYCEEAAPQCLAPGMWHDAAEAPSATLASRGAAMLLEASPPRPGVCAMSGAPRRAPWRAWGQHHRRPHPRAMSRRPRMCHHTAVAGCSFRMLYTTVSSHSRILGRHCEPAPPSPSSTSPQQAGRCIQRTRRRQPWSSTVQERRASCLRSVGWAREITERGEGMPCPSPGGGTNAHRAGVGESPQGRYRLLHRLGPVALQVSSTDRRSPSPATPPPLFHPNRDHGGKSAPLSTAWPCQRSVGRGGSSRPLTAYVWLWPVVLGDAASPTPPNHGPADRIAHCLWS